MYLLRQNRCVPGITGSRGDASLEILGNISGKRWFRKKPTQKRTRYEKREKQDPAILFEPLDPATPETSPPWTFALHMYPGYLLLP